jgi:aspartyl-tRNA(Asn)/glutamyl-tRNA(Gln) amidotransferase subunit C
MNPMIDVKKVATLARLTLTAEEETKYQKQLSAVFKYFEEIALIKTDGVEPLVTPSEIEQHWRDDAVKDVLPSEAALQNAPEKSGHLFKVPPVVG